MTTLQFQNGFQNFKNGQRHDKFADCPVFPHFHETVKKPKDFKDVRAALLAPLDGSFDRHTDFRGEIVFQRNPPLLTEKSHKQPKVACGFSTVESDFKIVSTQQ